MLRVLVGLLFVDVIGKRTEAVEIARAIAMGHGFSDPIRDFPTGPTALVPPVIPFLRGMAYRFLGLDSGAAIAAVLLFNSLSSAAVCVVLFYLGSHWYGPELGMRAAWAWALFPYAIVLSMPRSGEAALASLLVCLTFLMALRLGREPSPRAIHWFGFGLLSGFTVLAHTSALTVVALLLGWLLWKSPAPVMQRARLVALASLAVVMVISPWLVRNYVVFHQFVFLRSGFGLELYIGNSGNTEQYRDMTLHPTVNRRELRRMMQVGEIAYMAEEKAKAIEVIRAHPGAFLMQTVRHAGCFWTGAWDVRPQTLIDRPYYAASIVFCSLMVVLAIPGLAAVVSARRLGWEPLTAILFLYPLVYYVTHANERFRHPLDPFLILLVCIAFSRFPVQRRADSLHLDSAAGRWQQEGTDPSTLLLPSPTRRA